MKLTNESPFRAGWTVGFRPDGREVMSIAVKGTFALRPRVAGEPPQLSGEQVPLLEADVFGPDPAYDAPLLENDFAQFKPHCDVLLRPTAYAPHGRPSERVTVGVLVGGMRKLMVVVGERHWRRRASLMMASHPEPFMSAAISYDVAFGGIEVDPAKPDLVDTFLANPVGTGFGKHPSTLEGMRLPTTEEPEKPVENPQGPYRPMAFGPVGRNWLPRYTFAGTYDERWQNEKIPYLPDDFDYQYFQAAPADQWIPYPTGNEPVVLINLTPDGRLESSLPSETVWVTALRAGDRSVERQAVLDTVLIEPDEDRLSLTWRVAVPLDRDPFEIREIVVERGVDRVPARSRARLQHKRYYGSLDEAVRRGRPAR